MPLYKAKLLPISTLLDFINGSSIDGIYYYTSLLISSVILYAFHSIFDVINELIIISRGIGQY